VFRLRDTRRPFGKAVTDIVRCAIDSATDDNLFANTGNRFRSRDIDFPWLAIGFAPVDVHLTLPATDFAVGNIDSLREDKHFAVAFTDPL
jgi:hypothetical protein